MKSTTKQVPMALPEKMVEVIEWVNSALKLRTAVDEQIDKSAEEVEKAEGACREAEAFLEKMETDLALADSEEKSKELEKAVSDAMAEVEAARSTVERKKRVREALCRRALEVDHNIAEAQSSMNVERSILSQEIADQFADDLERVAMPVLAVLRRYAALNTVLNSRAIIDVIHGTVIQDPRDIYGGRSPLLASTFAKLNPADWQADTAAVAANICLQPIAEAQKRLAGHQPFVHPDKRPKPYVRKGFTMRGREADEASASAPRQNHTAARSEPKSAGTDRPYQPQEMNLGAVHTGDLANG